VLERFTFQSGVDDFVGTDLSLGTEYRPLLNNNVIMVGGISGLIAGDGFDDLFRPLEGKADNLFAGFFECILEY
jgi:hypothetical protein